MLNYIASEFYKATRRRYTWWLLTICALGCVALPLMIRIANSGQDAAASFLMMLMLLPTIYFAAAPVMDIVFSEEYKYQTMKNSIAHGVSRSTIYLGKLVTGLMLAILMAAALFLLHIGASLLILGVGQGTWEALADLGRRILAALPLWMGGVGFMTFLYFFFKSSTVAAMVFVFTFMLLGQVFQLLAYFISPVFTSLEALLMSAQLNQVAKVETLSSALMLRTWITGMAYLTGFTGLGVILFSKREIQ